MKNEDFSTVNDIELPFGSPDDTKVFKAPICECPLCKEEGINSMIYEGDKTFYCEKAVKEDKECGFILYKNNIEKLVRREITKEEVNMICEEGYFEATCTKINDDTKTYTGIFKFKPMGTYMGLSLNFPER